MMKSKKITGVLLAAVFAAALATGCGPKVKPAELSELEVMRQSQNAAKINKGAPDEFAKSTELYNESLSAWQDGNQQKATNYAELAIKQYKTAEAVAETKDAEARIAAANQEAKVLSGKLDALTAKKEGLTKSIDLLTQNIAQASAANVEQKILLAQAEREKCASMGAKESAAEDFKKADALLEQASKAVAAGHRDQATKLAESALTEFKAIYTKIKPEYERKMGNAQAAERKTSLLGAIHKGLGTAYGIVDDRGVVLVMASAFNANKTEINPDQERGLDVAAQIAKDYPDASLLIEGFTQDRAKNALAVSQARADNVRNALISRGIDIKRMATTGKGKENPRYDNKDKSQRSRNDRVEIVYVLR